MQPPKRKVSSDYDVEGEYVSEQPNLKRLRRQLTRLQVVPPPRPILPPSLAPPVASVSELPSWAAEPEAPPSAPGPPLFPRPVQRPLGFNTYKRFSPSLTPPTPE